MRSDQNYAIPHSVTTNTARAASTAAAVSSPFPLVHNVEIATGRSRIEASDHCQALQAAGTCLENSKAAGSCCHDAASRVYAEHGVVSHHYFWSITGSSSTFFCHERVLFVAPRDQDQVDLVLFFCSVRDPPATSPGGYSAPPGRPVFQRVVCGLRRCCRLSPLLWRGGTVSLDFVVRYRRLRNVQKAPEAFFAADAERTGRSVPAHSAAHRAPAARQPPLLHCYSALQRGARGDAAFPGAAARGLHQRARRHHAGRRQRAFR